MIPLLRRWRGALRRHARHLRQRYDDRRSDSLVAFGGPMDGKRLKLHAIFGIFPRDIEVWSYSVTGELFCLWIPTYCEGVYRREGDRWVWEQWSTVRDAVPPSDSEAP